MSLALFDKILADLAELGKIKALKLYLYGEPLQNPDIVAMLRLAKQKQIAERIELTTNGVMLTPSLSRELVFSGLDYLRVSVYDPKNWVLHDNLRRIKQLRTMASVDSPFLQAKLLATPKADTALFKQLWEPAVDEVVIDSLHDWNSGATEEDKHVPCPYPFYTLAIRSNGDVNACCVDWENGNNLGNIGHDSLKSLWESSHLRTLQLTHLSGEKDSLESCKSCKWFKLSPDSITLSPEEFTARCA